ncbi:MAG: DUF1836 domain-containing protein [Oscillospiraceae bacterium]|jgi:hypothetical protein|nr:DUF1836 domain-containing protein [Oscillospiraceae bacterium]
MEASINWNIEKNWAIENIPGTTLLYTDMNSQAFSYILPLIRAAGGLSLSQICTITGLEGSTIQNWVKRGWVGDMKRSKKYNERQVARILILNALRGSLQLDSIAHLLTYTSGVDGDLVNEGDLFSFMCDAAKNVGLNITNAEAIIEQLLADYTGGEERKNRLSKTLPIMVYACVCADLQQTANLRLMELV